MPGDFHAFWCGIAPWGLTSAATILELTLFDHEDKSIRGCLCVWRKGRLSLRDALVISSQLLSRRLEPLLSFAFLLFLVRANGSERPTLLSNGSFEEGQATPKGWRIRAGCEWAAGKVHHGKLEVQKPLRLLTE